MRRYVPVIVLFLLAPLVGELLFGATPLSRIFGLLPESLLYGGGAVLIRELARRRGTGWGRILLLGLAYAIVEEGLAIGSLFNPALFDAGTLGGRALGVNGVWGQWTLGYHAVWSITIPILMAELLFPARRAESWLGTVGVAAIGMVYALGVLAIGAIFRVFVAPDFHAPLLLLVGALLVIAALVVAALLWPMAPTASLAAEPTLAAPSPWLMGLLAVSATVAWFMLFGLPDALRYGTVVLLPMVGELALVAAVAALIRRWSAPDRRWTDGHRLALAWGAMLISMLMGIFFVNAGNLTDQIGQVVVSLVANGLLAWFAWQLRQRQTHTPEMPAAPFHAARP